ncbi:copper resistance protein NlpE [Shewanella olleyana]|uniref:copper resistance protein NlpE n=1 Tax=Shewanella olleyana TaxID=135626 RepID=UPI00200E0135|nr:copper resistance protein NlpE [Shewanella olleyana]MCL1066477.1 copper resistance protein NlpE [Shewanella olleyana]
MKTTLTLFLRKNKIATERLGQSDSPFNNGGVFHWEKTGNIIYLDRGQIYHVVEDEMNLVNVGCTY